MEITNRVKMIVSTTGTLMDWQTRIRQVKCATSQIRATVEPTGIVFSIKMRVSVSCVKYAIQLILKRR